MARIARSEYPKIQRMASVEGRKVAEIAGLYGCTPANIYAILARLRREGEGGAGTPSAAPDHPTEPRRICRRLSPLRRWSHDEEDLEPVFA